MRKPGCGSVPLGKQQGIYYSMVEGTPFVAFPPPRSRTLFGNNRLFVPEGRPRNRGREDRLDSALPPSEPDPWEPWGG